MIAVAHRRRAAPAPGASIAYFSFNSKRTKAYTIDPYRLVYYHGGLYLYARAQEYDEVRTFAVERIEKIEVLDAHLRDPARLQRLRVRARRLRHRGRQAGAGGGRLRARDGRLHPRARLAREPGDRGRARTARVVLRMSVTPGFELKSWIKGFLPHVRVVKPGAAAREIARDLEQARKSFKS